jgi:hypothetical protein
MESQMLLDIFPLCLYHNCPMILVEQTLHPRRLFPKEIYHWFACPVHGCNQRYDMKHGYYVMRDGVFEDATNVCRLFALSLFGEARLSDGGHSLALRKWGVFLE